MGNTLNAFLRGQALPQRPMRDLLLQLPLLTARPGEAIPYEDSDPALLVQIADNAEATMNTIHRGLHAVGLLLAHAAPEVDTGELSGEAAESLGWLVAELSDAAATSMCLVAACRRYTADFDPPERRVIANPYP